MLPHQFKRLLELLRTELGAIHEAIQRYTSANHDARKIAHDEWAKVPGIIASNVLGTKDDKTAADTRNKKQESQQDKIIFWARLTFFAAAAYGAVAFWQGLLMRHTYTEIQRQTIAAQCTAKAAQEQATLMRQELVTVAGAVVTLNIGAFNRSESELPFVQLQWQNVGHGNATQVQFRGVRVYEVRIPSGEEIGPLSLNLNPDFTYEIVPPTPSGESGMNREIHFRLPSPDFDGFYNGKIGIALKGLLTYNNGFADKPEDMIHASFCWVQINLEEDQLQQDGSLHIGWQEEPVKCDDLRNTFDAYSARNEKVRAQQKAAQH
jgi:hypothetical protein